jgi:hypothetical protein
MIDGLAFMLSKLRRTSNDVPTHVETRNGYLFPPVGTPLWMSLRCWCVPLAAVRAVARRCSVLAQGRKASNDASNDEDGCSPFFAFGPMTNSPCRSRRFGPTTAAASAQSECSRSAKTTVTDILYRVGTNELWTVYMLQALVASAYYCFVFKFRDLDLPVPLRVTNMSDLRQTSCHVSRRHARHVMAVFSIALFHLSEDSNLLISLL